MINKRPISLLIVLHTLVVLISLILLIRQKGETRKGREKIVVIPIRGTITMGNDSYASRSSFDSVMESLEQLREKDNVKAVVLQINSPGGSVGAVQELYSAVKKLKAKGKVVVSSFGDVAASGGYYVACAGDKIVSEPGTLTGSIGVVMQLPNFQGLAQKIGVSMETIKSGRMKDAGSPFRKMTEEERQHFQDVILDAYDQFLQGVKEGRNFDEKVLLPLADGRIFSGRIAFQNKLVDELGGLPEAVELAKKLAGLEQKNPEVVYQKERPSLEHLMRLFSRQPFDSIPAFSNEAPLLLYQLK